MLKIHVLTQVGPAFATDTRYVAPLKIVCQEEQRKSVSPIGVNAVCVHVQVRTCARV
jgi:hypothetical protein